MHPLNINRCRTVCMIGSLLCCSPVHALTTEVRLGSDYLWRGFSQTLGNPNIQMEFTEPFKKEFYVDENIAQIYYGQQDPAFVEFTSTFGVGHEFKNGVAIDLSLSHCDYPRAQIYRYTELHSLTTYKDIGILLEYAPTMPTTSHQSYYAEFQYQHTFKNTYKLGASVGYWRIHDGMEGGYGNTVNYGIGISHTVKGIVGEISWHNNPGTHPPFLINGSRLMLTLSKTWGETAD